MIAKLGLHIPFVLGISQTPASLPCFVLNPERGWSVWTPAGAPRPSDSGSVWSLGDLEGEKRIQVRVFYLFPCRDNTLPQGCSWVGYEPQTKFTVPLKVVFSVCLPSSGLVVVLLYLFRFKEFQQLYCY